MRPIARQSARLANTTKAIQSPTSPAQPNLKQRRPFSASPRRREPRTPNGQQPDHNTPVTGRNEASKKDPAESTKLGKEDTPPQASVTTESDPKPTSTSTSTSAWKHLPTTRNNNTASKRERSANYIEVPKPPPIPDWFLAQNVRLYRDSPGVEVCEGQGRGQVIRCVDAETGHELFRVPWYEAWPTGGERPGSEVGGAKGEQGAAEHEEAEVEENGGKSSSQDQSLPDQSSLALDSTPRQTGKDATRHPTPCSEPFSPSNLKDSDATTNPLRWPYLEASLSIHAAFTLATSNLRSAYFASNRVDLSLQCPDAFSHDAMDEYVRDLARITHSDYIRLDANDFAELAGEYVGQGSDEPGSFSTLAHEVFEGYSAASLPSSHSAQRNRDEEAEEDDYEDDEEGEEDEQSPARGDDGVSRVTSWGEFKKTMQALQGGNFGLGGPIRARIVGVGSGSSSTGQAFFAPQRSGNTSLGAEDRGKDDARLGALLESLLDAPAKKSSRATDANAEISGKSPLAMPKHSAVDQDKSYQRILRYWRSNSAFWLPQTARSLVGYLTNSNQGQKSPAFNLTTSSKPPPAASETEPSTAAVAAAASRTIVHIRDLRDICNLRLGEQIINRLVKIVRKRRRSGEQILIVGTTSQDVPGPFRLAGEQSEDFPFRALHVPPFFNFTLAEDNEFESLYAANHPGPSGSSGLDWQGLAEPAYRRILEINLRHVQSMLSRLRPDDKIDLLGLQSRAQLDQPGMHFLTERVLSLDAVQRLVLTAIGLSREHAVSETVKPIHLSLARMVMMRADYAEHTWNLFKAHKHSQARLAGSTESSNKADGINPTTTQNLEARMAQLKKTCNPHETKLLSGVVDPRNLRTTFEDVHAPEETLEALKTLTTLSLLRPEAFKYGVLASDRLSGLLLYGPPGTGKTLLAKAVAKEASATVLEVSGAQIYEKYVGEGEKMVRAVFTLAKKLTPCVVFIDEADAIFGSRSSGGGNRNTHREIINQFLREWDGLGENGVFVMCASNRPFDVDDAVLRRLPRRLLVDLPVVKDREKILGIHLKDEILHKGVSLGSLAEQTPLYSGSDLKNLAVAAALACVREENSLLAWSKAREAAAEAKGEVWEATFVLPEKRTLRLHHFEKALQEISASISEDMGSLAAIRKFDEQYGDRKGRRKRASYGFGDGGERVDEGAARVRQPERAPGP